MIKMKYLKFNCYKPRCRKTPNIFDLYYLLCLKRTPVFSGQIVRSRQCPLKTESTVFHIDKDQLSWVNSSGDPIFSLLQILDVFYDFEQF